MYQGLIAIVLGFGVATAFADEVYRWQDEGGRWHFGGRQSAPEYAKLFESTTPVSVVEMKKVVLPADVGSVSDTRRAQKKTARREKSKRSGNQVGDVVGDEASHQVFCDKWRERLRRSRLGMLDHEGQSAYERECILKVHW